MKTKILLAILTLSSMASAQTQSNKDPGIHGSPVNCPNRTDGSLFDSTNPETIVKAKADQRAGTDGSINTVKAKKK
jgi:hypothetical protein